MNDLSSEDKDAIDKFLAGVMVVVISIFGFLMMVDPGFRDDVFSIMQSFHMGVCVDWVDNSDYKECAKWGGF